MQVLIDYWPSILALTGIQLSGVISPGPDLTVVVRNSLIYSRRTGVLTAVGVAFGIFFHLAYILLGLGVFISKTPWLFHIFKYLGAGYLIYIGVKGIMVSKGAMGYGDIPLSDGSGEILGSRRGGIFDPVLTPGVGPLEGKTGDEKTALDRQPKASGTIGKEYRHHQKDISSVAALRSGFLTNALNVKCMLFFLSILSAFLAPGNPGVIIFIYGAILFLTTLIWFLIVALCFSHERLRTSFSNFHHWIERGTGGLLLLLGIKMLFIKAGSVS